MSWVFLCAGRFSDTKVNNDIESLPSCRGLQFNDVKGSHNIGLWQRGRQHASQGPTGQKHLTHLRVRAWKNQEKLGERGVRDKIFHLLFMVFIFFNFEFFRLFQAYKKKVAWIIQIILISHSSYALICIIHKYIQIYIFRITFLRITFRDYVPFILKYSSVCFLRSRAFSPIAYNLQNQKFNTNLILLSYPQTLFNFCQLSYCKFSCHVYLVSYSLE